jgi:hypothetical protein
MPKLALPTELAALRAEAKKLWSKAARAATGRVIQTLTYATPAYSFRPFELERAGQTPGRPEQAKSPRSSSYGVDESGKLWTALERSSQSAAVRSPEKTLFLTKTGADVSVVELRGDERRPHEWRWASRYAGGLGRQIADANPRCFRIEETVWDLLYGTMSTVVDCVSFDESGAVLQVVREAPAHAARLLWARSESAAGDQALEQWLVSAVKTTSAPSAAILTLSDRGATLVVLDAAALEGTKERPVTEHLNPAEHECVNEIPVPVPASVPATRRRDILTQACKAASKILPTTLFAVTPPDMSTLEASVRAIHGDAKWKELTRAKRASKRRA